ncbi:hypothetical protein AJ78_02643 [Emergomyces pasteurianus Ep9510]|uniref:Uncharacterized protein n=1 Tax=Emergomyces pasteurianus Ep9510 TaxID=1447872 RepID=A0A1J9QPT4_9EURO|nr:hypothetical protein AJ78_02643 [Emergomyces pasteurianus Ep9510]
MATLVTLAASQQATVPADLAESFSPSGTEGLQVRFGGDASEGIPNGLTVGPEAVSGPPTFALGDSSGVNRAVSYIIAMLDTTDDDARKVQFLQSGFKATGDKTKVRAEGEPAVPYEPPSLERGPRQFSFLLYRQRGQELARLGGIPSVGSTEPFDVKAFEAANNLQPPRVGMAIIVDGNAGRLEQSPPSSTSAPVFVPFATLGTLASSSASTIITTFVSTVSSAGTAATVQDNVTEPPSIFVFTFTPAPGSPPHSPSPSRFDSLPSSAQSLTESTSTAHSTSLSASVSPTPAAGETQTSVVVVMASPTSTTGAASGDLASAAGEIDSGNSAASVLHGSANSGMFLSAILLVAQVVWYSLAL